MTQLKTLFTAAALAGLPFGLAACNNPESAPEPENEAVAEMMPATPDAAASREAAADGAAGLTPPTTDAPPEPQDPAAAPVG